MEISFATERLEKDLNDHARMVKEYGAELSKAMQKRLADLDSAQHEMALLATQIQSRKQSETATHGLDRRAGE